MGIAAGTRLGPYLIHASIGAGGQGEVYKAVDTTLDRPVVIKVLPDEHTVRPASVERFRREAKLAASLDHPNICTIHGLYEENNLRYIAMQFVEGKNVRELVDGHPLELGSALAIAIQTADALAAAHARGIIHRDIKAANVMVTNAGTVKVLDFGLAKLLEESGEDTDDQHLTEVGVPYGTATYAAPEQARGGMVDHRADIFSTGVLLYELVTGTWPFKGSSAVEVRYAVLHCTPKPLAEVRGENSPIIEKLQQIVDHALAKEPADRYQQVGQLRDDLRAILNELDPEASQATSYAGRMTPVAPRHLRGTGKPTAIARYKTAIIGAAAAVVLAGLIAVVYLARVRQPGVESLAVLPFINVSADPSTEYLSEGITEGLINSLSQLPAVKVRSRNSVFLYKGKGANPETIGRDLGVHVVVAGRVEKVGNNLSVNVELIDTKDDSHIWGQSYTHSLADLLVLQSELSRDITNNLRLRLSSAEQQKLVKHYPTNSEAYQLYLQGRYYWNKRTAEGLNKGIEYFTRVIEKDPNYAPAYSGLADCNFLLNVYNMGPATESNPKAREAALKALTLDETLAEAHASLASVSYRYDWNWQQAEQHFKRAIQLKPEYVTAHQWYSAMLAAMGRFAEANAEAQRAHELEPFFLTINFDLGHHLYYARQFDQALAVHRKTLEMDRNFSRAHVDIGYILAQKGKHAEAVAEFQQALTLDKESINALVGLGYAYAISGKKTEAMQIVAQLKELAKQRYISPYHLAVIYTGLGDREQALTELEKAADERFNWFVFIKVEPLFDSLRSEPRFTALVGRLGLN